MTVVLGFGNKLGKSDEIIFFVPIVSNRTFFSGVMPIMIEVLSF